MGGGPARSVPYTRGIEPGKQGIAAPQPTARPGLPAHRRQPAQQCERTDRRSRRRPDLVLSPLDKLEEPESLVALRGAVDARMPRVDLPELVLEIQARTGFADAFCHASEARARAQDIATSVCAVLVSEA